MIRLGVITDIESVLEIVRSGVDRHDFFGVSCKIASSTRLNTFAHKGTTCVFCDCKATHFAVQKNSELDGSYHLELYGERNGKQVMFTKDHIVPKSKGGSNRLKNMQPACERCNVKKGNNPNYRGAISDKN